MDWNKMITLKKHFIIAIFVEYRVQLLYLFISSLVVNFTGCGIYSFTGSSVPEHLSTIAIPIAEDRSGSGIPGLREMLTNQLVQKFIDDNTLQVTEKVNANAILECNVTSISDAPAVVTAGETVESRRVTVNVQVVYKDLVIRKTVFERNFSDIGDYSANGGFTGRDLAIETALNKITDDILLDVVSGW